jgi:hypothetical protein
MSDSEKIKILAARLNELRLSAENLSPGDDQEIFEILRQLEELETKKQYPKS